MPDVNWLAAGLMLALSAFYWWMGYVAGKDSVEMRHMALEIGKMKSSIEANQALRRRTELEIQEIEARLNGGT